MSTLRLPRGASDANWIRSGRRDEPTNKWRAWVDDSFKLRYTTVVISARMRPWFGKAIVANPKNYLND